MKVKFPLIAAIAMAASLPAFADSVTCDREAMAAGNAPAACAKITRALLGAPFERVTLGDPDAPRLPYELGGWVACYKNSERAACAPMSDTLGGSVKATFSLQIARAFEAWRFGASDVAPSAMPSDNRQYSPGAVVCFREAMAAGQAPAGCERILPFLLGEKFESITIDPSAHAPRLPAALNGSISCVANMDTTSCEPITNYPVGIQFFTSMSDADHKAGEAILRERAGTVKAVCSADDECEIVGNSADIIKTKIHLLNQ